MEKQTLCDAIKHEIAQFNEITKRDQLGITCKPVVDAEIDIALAIPNLAEAKRFFKIRPSWAKTPHPMARNDAYYRYCINHIENRDGLWLEFGVKFGKSAKILTNIKKEEFSHVQKPLYGFDSFVGFPEKTEWGRKGALTTEGVIPDIEGAEFYEGWFEDTIPVFNRKHSETLALLHIDCDIYSSTATVFEGVGDKIVPGTVILFDDILAYSQRRDLWAGEKHELKAFMEFVEKYQVEYKWLASVPNASQAACIIKGIRKD
tara:strand:- start:1428 stop:2210 length:783 start_codon:yes stop_codon:yes gene_type:complete